jgi:hypothetical protein
MFLGEMFLGMASFPVICQPARRLHVSAAMDANEA